MIEWNQRLIAFVREIEVGDRLIAGALLVGITGNWQDLGSFSVPVTDESDRLWYGCSSACHEGLRSRLAAILADTGCEVRFVILQLTQEDDWVVFRSTNPALIGQTWEITQSFSKALEELGFSRIVLEPLN